MSASLTTTFPVSGTVTSAPKNVSGLKTVTFTIRQGGWTDYVNQSLSVAIEISEDGGKTWQFLVGSDHILVSPDAGIPSSFPYVVNYAKLLPPGILARCVCTVHQDPITLQVV